MENLWLLSGHCNTFCAAPSETVYLLRRRLALAVYTRRAPTSSSRWWVRRYNAALGLSTTLPNDVFRQFTERAMQLAGNRCWVHWTRYTKLVNKNSTRFGWQIDFQLDLSHRWVFMCLCVSRNRLKSWCSFERQRVWQTDWKEWVGRFFVLTII